MISPLRDSGMSTVVLSLVFTTIANAFYVPGTYPEEFEQGDAIRVKVNSLTSSVAQLPYDYYSLPFCKPAHGVKRSTSSMNLGTTLSGLRMYNSLYDFHVNEPEMTKAACKNGSAGPLTKDQAKDLQQQIDDHYRARLVLDNLPITTADLAQNNYRFPPGFELGVAAGGQHYVFNHLAFNVLIQRTRGGCSPRPRDQEAALREAAAASGIFLDPDPCGPASATGATGDAPAWMIVGFEVMPCSIKRDAGKPLETIFCYPWGHHGNPEPQVVAEGEDIVYTYDVYWEESGTPWVSRWDAYLQEPGDSREVHWFSIINSLTSLVLVAFIAAVALLRTVRCDVARWEKLLVRPQRAAELSGWKLISGDVFRPPPAAPALAVCVGTGAQILCTAAVTLLLAAAGLLSPASRGSLLTSAVALYLLMGPPGGYAAVWLWCNTQRSPDGWVGVCVKTACCFPGFVLALSGALNATIANTSAANTPPLATFVHLAALCLCVNVPLACLGGYAASRAPLVAWPASTNKAPRDVPPPRLRSHPALLFIVAGILPFCVMYIELYFVMAALWEGHLYQLFGYFAIAAGQAVLITIGLAVSCTYSQLCAQDYNWWWRSFHRGGAAAVYLVVSAVRFRYSHLSGMRGLSVLLYAAYMAVVAAAAYLCLGAVGFAASLAFVRAAYARLEAAGRGGQSETPGSAGGQPRTTATRAERHENGGTGGGGGETTALLDATDQP